VRLAGRPSERVAGGEVEPEPLRGRSVELEVVVRAPEREMRRHPDGVLAAVGHSEVDPVTAGREFDVAFTEADRAGPVISRGSERFPKDEEACALVEEDLHTDLGHDARDTVQHLIDTNGGAAGRGDLVERRTAAAGRVHLVAHERHRLGRVQPESLREGRPCELGGGEDAESFLLGRGQLHAASVPSGAMTRSPDDARPDEPSRDEPSRDDAPEAPSFREAARFWIWLGFVNFGGPAGQISLMHQELVERRRWIDEGRFLHALSYCMLLPGPEATQLATYIGWLLHRIRGGLVAGIAFVLPSFFLLMGLSWIFVSRGDLRWVAGAFAGLAAAVVAIVAQATVRLARTALANGLMVGVAVASFVAIFVLDVPFPIVVAVSVAFGLLGGIIRPSLFEVGVGRELEERATASVVGRIDAPVPSWSRNLAVLTVGLATWLLPIAAVALWRKDAGTLADMGWFFSKAALVTFGGAYAVLAYVDQAAVGVYGWLRPGQMAVGLGLAESTPGPLIMVLEFVGFVGAYQHPGGLPPLLAGILGASVAVWATFAPCFLWIFLGAPYVERLRGNARLASALQTVTAAVVGVIGNLAVTFGVLTLFRAVRFVAFLGGEFPVPVLTEVDPFALAVATVAFVGLWRFRWKVVPVILGSAAAGLVIRGLW
jgi:chromate transporter